VNKDDSNDAEDVDPSDLHVEYDHGAGDLPEGIIVKPPLEEGCNQLIQLTKLGIEIWDK
jgi:hypothetical protein